MERFEVRIVLEELLDYARRTDRPKLRWVDNMAAAMRDLGARHSKVTTQE